MYNWSVDEKKFKKIEEIIKFLKNQPDIEKVIELNKGDKYGNSVIKVKLSSNIHPVREFFITKYIEERIGGLKISIKPIFSSRKLKNLKKRF